MNKKKILKIVGIILLIIIIIFLAHTISNYVIIKDLQNKIAKYSNSTNYHIKSIATEENGTIVTMEYYKKDEKQALFMERNLNGEISKTLMYNNGKRTDSFIETQNEKIAHLDSGTMMSISIYNQLETDNNWQTFLSSIFTKIKSTKYEEKDCYVITGFLSNTSLTEKETEIFIDKETGLVLQVKQNGIITEKEYEFDNVDSSIFVEPDISQYTLKK